VSTCPTCKKEFPNDQELAEHKKTHSGSTKTETRAPTHDMAPVREHRFWRRKGE
jgi:hypothetical protein